MLDLVFSSVSQDSDLLFPSKPGTLIVLKCPYPWRVEEPSIYESVRVHTAIQTGRTENDLVPNAPSVCHLLHTHLSSWCLWILKFLCNVTEVKDNSSPLGSIFIVLAIILMVMITWYSSKWPFAKVAPYKRLCNRILQQACHLMDFTTCSNIVHEALIRMILKSLWGGVFFLFSKQFSKLQEQTCKEHMLASPHN